MYRIIYIFLSFLLSSVAAFATSDINSKTEVIQEGVYDQPNSILKIQYYNIQKSEDLYITFIKTDDDGKWSLLKDDLMLPKLEDGDIEFELYANSTNTKVDSFSKKLDKGLKLKVALYVDYALENDEYINKEEQNSLFIRLQSERNLQELTITLSDKQGNRKKYTLDMFDDKVDSMYGAISLEEFADGEITLHSVAEDTIGNKTETTKTYIKDTTILEPVVTAKIKNNNLANVVNKKIIVAKGQAEPYATVVFHFQQNNVFIDESVVADGNGSFELVGGDIDATLFEFGDVEVEVYQIDSAHNTSSTLYYINKKFKKPIFPISPLPIDAIKYQLIHTIKGHEDFVHCVAVGEQELYSGSFESLKAWGKSYARFIREKKFPNTTVNDILIDDDKLYVALSNGDIMVLNQYTFKTLEHIHADKLSVHRLAKYKNYIISGGSNGEIKLWDFATHKLVHSFTKHQWEVNALYVDGNILYSGGSDYDINMWDLEQFKLLKTLRTAHTGDINDLLVVGNMLISASSDKTIKVLDKHTLKTIQTLAKHKGSVNRLAFVNGYLVTASDDRTVILWEVENNFKVLKKLRGHAKPILDLAVNDFNIVTASKDKTVKIWGYDDSKESLDADDETNLPIYGLVKKLPLKRDGVVQLVNGAVDIAVLTDGYIDFYNKTTFDFEKEYSTLDVIAKQIVAKKKKETDEEEDDEEEQNQEEEYQQKLQQIRSGAVYENSIIVSLADKALKVWDMETNKAVAMLFSSDSLVNDIITTSNYFVLAQKNGNILVIDRETKEVVNILEGHQYDANTLAVFNDEWVLSGGDDYSIKIRDLDTGDMVLDIKNAHEDQITKLVLDENKIISGSKDGVIKVRSIQDGKLLEILLGHSGAISDIDVDEEHMVTASEDGTLRVWSLDGFTLVKTIQAHKGGVVSVRFTEDYIVSVGKDETIKVWKYYE